MLWFFFPFLWSDKFVDLFPLDALVVCVIALCYCWIAGLFDSWIFSFSDYRKILVWVVLYLYFHYIVFRVFFFYYFYGHLFSFFFLFFLYSCFSLIICTVDCPLASYLPMLIHPRIHLPPPNPPTNPPQSTILRSCWKGSRKEMGGSCEKRKFSTDYTSFSKNSPNKRM